MAKMDKNQPYGIIMGPPPVPGARFEQGGKYFTTAGDEIGGEPEEVVETPGYDVEPDPEEEDLESTVKALDEQGMTHTEIAARLDITRQKVTAICR